MARKFLWAPFDDFSNEKFLKTFIIKIEIEFLETFVKSLNWPASTAVHRYWVPGYTCTRVPENKLPLCPQCHLSSYCHAGGSPPKLATPLSTAVPGYHALWTENLLSKHEHGHHVRDPPHIFQFDVCHFCAFD